MPIEMLVEHSEYPFHYTGTTSGHEFVFSVIYSAVIEKERIDTISPSVCLAPSYLSETSPPQPIVTVYRPCNADNN
jgi:hypothetical protein